ACKRSVLKVADHGGKRVIVRRVCVVEYRFRQRIVPMQSVQERPQGGHLRPVSDGIEAGVGTESSHGQSAGVAPGSDVELACPSFLRVQAPEELQEIAREFCRIHNRWFIAGTYPGKDGGALAMSAIKSGTSI